MSPLFSPLKFLEIRHGWWVRYNIVLPAIGGAVLTGIATFSPDHNAIFGESGLLKSLESPLAIVGGFFIAALTLVTSDQSETLKSLVGGNTPPKLKGEILSRRRFLAFLFGYLTFASFALLVFSHLNALLSPISVKWLSSDVLTGLRYAGTGLVGAWITHIGVATLLGLYYFTERLQVSDRKVRMHKPTEKLPLEHP